MPSRWITSFRSRPAENGLYWAPRVAARAGGPARQPRRDRSGGRGWPQWRLRPPRGQPPDNVFSRTLDAVRLSGSECAGPPAGRTRGAATGPEPQPATTVNKHLNRDESELRLEY
ncbi:hypothetical protein TUSST3_37740 [Streptomyces sp. TUS-ST3]|nr:hypothetical protein TUSST3_37740 [Streptomyces sp. TUS-ST3]